MVYTNIRVQNEKTHVLQIALMINTRLRIETVECNNHNNFKNIYRKCTFFIVTTTNHFI